ncbi:hypothetical protein PM3016_3593 [Paenibacillus mucilaginosus 3016]|uniref:Uncharacterized protein n=1 Tax=Paenibacillus mucilaginosus 3016 TaxID=1116391 RepID=H6NMS7_9BACL|nr:hypothetical protein PM3016_3593 [Paenibacillus mucilaginosus 3016]
MQGSIRKGAQDIFRNHLKHVADGFIKAWVELWQEEEFPYDPAGSQGKKIGKLELYDYMKDVPKRFDRILRSWYFIQWRVRSSSRQ